MINVIDSVAVTHEANHAAVNYFRGFALRMSTGGQVEFRLAAVGGKLLWVVDTTTNVSNGLVFPVAMETPGGVFVHVVSGTLGDTSSVLLNGR